MLRDNLAGSSSRVIQKEAEKCFPCASVVKRSLFSAHREAVDTDGGRSDRATKFEVVPNF